MNTHKRLGTTKEIWVGLLFVQTYQQRMHFISRTFRNAKEIKLEWTVLEPLILKNIVFTKYLSYV